jgi:hypothetical protein
VGVAGAKALRQNLRVNTVLGSEGDRTWTPVVGFDVCCGAQRTEQGDR